MKNYRSKPFKAIQLTEENINEVLEVVRGSLVSIGYLGEKVDGINISNFLNEIKFVKLGDYIIKYDDGSVCEWEREWFESSYECITEEKSEMVNYDDVKKIVSAFSSTVTKLLGGISSNAYTNYELFKATWDDVNHEIMRQFNVKNYYEIPKNKLFVALAVIENHVLALWLAEAIYECNYDICAQVAASETNKSFFS